uniref:Uncharacterized protein MANES_06G159400 n=1 Tax=Rhizophora mucronata TaxID=61149 RepID=A0A2P2MNW0_RHIMU
MLQPYVAAAVPGASSAPPPPRDPLLPPWRRSSSAPNPDRKSSTSGNQMAPVDRPSSGLLSARHCPASRRSLSVSTIRLSIRTLVGSGSSPNYLAKAAARRWRMLWRC